MKCIVTAGPTYEELDKVRRLTNFSTGALGTELAHHLAGQGHNVILLRGYYSTCQPAGAARSAQTFTTSDDLTRRLGKLASPGVGAVFHTAAVGDFAFGAVWRRSPGGKLSRVRSMKIPTGGGAVLAELKPTPKILSRLRGWFPAARLVGWKYEVEGGAAKAVALGQRQIEQSSTDACVVNGPGFGKGFGFVTPTGGCVRLGDKMALFLALSRWLEEG